MDISLQEIHFIIDFLPFIRELNSLSFDGCNILDEEFIDLTHSLHHKTMIRSLSFQDNKITEVGFNDFLDIQKEYFPNLKELFLIGNKITLNKEGYDYVVSLDKNCIFIILFIIN